MSDTDNKDESLLILDNPAERAAREAMRLFNYGDTIPKDWLLEKFQIEYPEQGTREEFEQVSFALLGAMSEFTEILKENNMILRNMRSVGWQIVTPAQQTEFAMQELGKDLKKSVKKAKERLTCIRLEQLSDKEKKRNAEALNNIAALTAFNKDRKLTHQLLS